MYNVDRREHELRCEYFGADLGTDPKQLPYYEDTETNEWFNSDNVPVAGPLRCGNASDVFNEQQSPESGDDVEYRLPASVEPLPPSWHWSLTADGIIYYYNLRDRISQWEPPNSQQRMQQLIDDSPVPEQTSDNQLLADELVNIDVDYVGSLSDKSLAQYIEAKVQERRELRRNRLVSICVISPRREEDRIYNQLESRKYKDNKEKIRRRKEIFRRTQAEASNVEPVGAIQANDMVPIQGYLYSSDEELVPNAASVVLNCAAQPLIDIIVDGIRDTHVDELVALNPSSNYKIGTLSVESSNIIAGPTLSDSDADVLVNTKRKLPMPPQLTESKKKHRGEREKKRKT